MNPTSGADDNDVATRFPCSLALDIPLPTPRLASVALEAIQVDRELSPLVHRRLAVIGNASSSAPNPDTTILHVDYRAATNRMLRVAVNSFMDSLRLVIEVMEQLDVDVLASQEQLKGPS